MNGVFEAAGSRLGKLLPWRLRSFNNLVLASPNAFFRGVRHTPPQAVDPKSPIELHALICNRDVNMMLTAAKSLLQYCPPVAVVLHDDGSISDADQAAFAQHLPGARIVSRAEADHTMRQVLAPEVFEKRRQHFFLLKLFDFNYFNTGTRTLMLDSDILFLRRPDEIVAWMTDPDPKPFYNQDPCPSYRASHVPNGMQLPVFLNAGFMGYKGQFDLAEIVRWGTQTDYWLEDQTLYALLLATLQPLALDRERYRVYLGEEITDQTTMVHFISPKRFDRLLYPRLARRVFRQLQVGRTGTN